MGDIKDLPVNTRVMAPLGDVLHRGVVVEPRGDHPQGKDTVCIKFTPPVEVEKPFNAIEYVTCPIDRITLGWF